MSLALGKRPKRDAEEQVNERRSAEGDPHGVVEQKARGEYRSGAGESAKGDQSELCGVHGNPHRLTY